MPGLRVVSGAVAGGLVAAGVAATAQATARHSRVVAAVQRRLEDTTYQRLGDLGTVDALSVLPLIERSVQRPGLRGEPGVSYLVRAGSEVLLFDTGLNLFGRSPLGPGRQRRGAGGGPRPGAGGRAVAPA